MLRRGLVGGLTFATCVIIALALLTFFVPFWHVWKWQNVSMKLCIADGATEIWYASREKGVATNLKCKWTWPGVSWNMRREASHGYWHDPGRRMRWVPGGIKGEYGKTEGAVDSERKPPEGFVRVDPTFKVEQYVRVSLFVPLVTVGLVPIAMFVFVQARRYHRRARGQCVKCGYLLTGNVSGVCPECGSSV